MSTRRTRRSSVIVSMRSRDDGLTMRNVRNLDIDMNFDQDNESVSSSVGSDAQRTTAFIQARCKSRWNRNHLSPKSII